VTLAAGVVFSCCGRQRYGQDVGRGEERGERGRLRSLATRLTQLLGTVLLGTQLQALPHFSLGLR